MAIIKIEITDPDDLALLTKMTQRHGRTIEQEAGAIIRNALRKEREAEAVIPYEKSGAALADAVRARFADIGYADDLANAIEASSRELSGQHG